MTELRYQSADYRNSNIMRTQTYDTHKLRTLLKRRKITRMDELKDALGAKADITVFRKLNELVCYSSYSHLLGIVDMNLKCKELTESNATLVDRNIQSSQ